MKPLAIPTVHLNGTSQSELLNQQTDAAQAIFKAMNALNDASPNGRDYYPQGPDALKKAQKEHADRMQRLRSVYEELQQIAKSLADQ